MTVTHQWVDDTQPIIPPIDDVALRAFASEFTHLLRKGDTFTAVRTPWDTEDLRNTSCIWSPRLIGERQLAESEELRAPFYVTCGYYGFFKPSISEVASQVPLDEIRARGLNAFYIGDHVEILRSGAFQRATAIFVKIADNPDTEQAG
ncbi:hypothetical protein SAMN05216456_1282 [Devosia crocina]|uniref:Uncharacterized protein n=1 Tax=Devosia crocina TaxID=429728 RepID=A0A1I7N9B7_9HYPH|nr:hypothetical protein [Devosia crocina]SFV31255.1 hypothetical protein SAMN05216456_1282 [Devosia crocina]